MTDPRPAAGPSAHALLRLMQLVSPALPVGTYAYSQGLESAVEHNWVLDENSARDWIRGVLLQELGQVDLPLLLRLQESWRSDDMAALDYWSALLGSLRESGELLQEDRQLGTALARLLQELGMPEAEAWRDHPQRNYASLFALAAQRWGIAPLDAAYGYAWSWLENQVAAAIKLIPLGQTAGQRMLSELAAEVPGLVAAAGALQDDDIGALLPGLAIAAAWHETQYSRLFRS